MEVEDGLVDSAIEGLNALYLGKGLELGIAVGEYLVEVFFGGELRAWRHVGGGHASLKAMSRDPRLRMSATFLWQSLNLIEQIEVLPERVWQALTVTEHRELFRLRDRRVKAQLAHKAVEGGWRVAAIKEAVKEAVAAERARRLAAGEAVEASAGRPALASWTKAGKAAQKALEEVSVTREEVVEHGPREAAQAARRLREVAERAEALAASLESFLHGRDVG